jgi:enterochelin esterase-like enzyme
VPNDLLARAALEGAKAVISRRAVLASAAGAFVSRRAVADVDPGWRARDLELREIHSEGGVASRLFVLGIPRHLAPFERVPLLVLLHGLGETGDPRMGAWAWFERYGLGTAYDRLRASPSFRGLVLACPYMPNFAAVDPRGLDGYADWIADTVVPVARSEAPVLAAPSATYLGGCSLGGHFSLEVMLRRPEAFAAWGGVQTAIGESAAARYAARLLDAIARAGSRDLLVETSTEDPFRRGSEALSSALVRAGVDHRFIVLPGAHDQAWLRRSGTPTMLQWFDDRPRREQRPAPPDRPLAPG